MIMFMGIKWALYLGMRDDRYVPISPFTLYEGSNPKASIEPLSLDFLNESHQIVISTELILFNTLYI
jgi:hypothetical protein